MTTDNVKCPTCGKFYIAAGCHECPFCTYKWDESVETDPTGRSANEAGAKLDHGKNRLSLVLHGFARAIDAVGKVGTYGAQKYSDNGWRTVPDGFNRYTDAMYRHLLLEAQGEIVDPETGLHHAAQTAWNALARLERLLAEETIEPQPAKKASFPISCIRCAENLFCITACPEINAQCNRIDAELKAGGL